MYELRPRVLRIDTCYALDTAGERLHEYRPVGAPSRFLWIDLAVASSPGVELRRLEQLEVG